jgi:hypothetical protein
VEAAAPVTSAQVVLPQAVARSAPSRHVCAELAVLRRCRFGSPVRIDEAVVRVAVRLFRDKHSSDA